MASAMIGPILAGIAAGGSGALFSRFGSRKQKEKIPRFKRELIDQLLDALHGEGPLAQLFQFSPDTFKTSIVEPLLQQFRTTTAPNIQQRFIQAGQQRGTPMESALTRAGTDVQSQINRLFLPFQQQGQQNILGIINSILGIPSPGQTSQITPFGGGMAGLASSGAIEDIIAAITGGSSGGQQPSPIQPSTLRRGFAP